MTWNQNKILFNYIVNQDYKILKNSNITNIIIIKWEQFEIKCKYFMVFTIDEKNDIYWACDNLLVDQKTKYLSFNVKNKIDDKKKYSTSTLNNLKNFIQSNFSIIYEDEKIDFIWCLFSNYNKKYIQFYIITEIINFY